jgi:hypothetical protein
MKTYIGIYKHPRIRKLVYYRVSAETREEAIKSFPAEIIHNNKVYLMYGFIGEQKMEGLK